MLQRALIVGKQFAHLLSREGLTDPAKLREPGVLRGEPGDQRLLLSLAGPARLERLLGWLFDEDEFLSPHGLRALSAWHRDHPYELDVEGISGQHRLRAGRIDHGHVRRELQLARPGLVPAELPDDQRAGALPPVLRRRADHRVPDRVGRAAHAGLVARDLSDRLISIFTRGPDGRRPCFGGTDCCRTIPPGGTTWSSASTSTATTAPRSVPRTRPAGPG